MVMDLNVLTGKIIGAAIEVHRHLGPGLLESAYAKCLMRELSLRGMRFKHEWPVAVAYKGVRLDSGYRVDLLVEDAVVVEVKAVESLAGIRSAAYYLS